MSAAKRTRREPTDDWQQLQLLTRFPEQLTDALLRPVVLFGHAPAERARFTGTPERTLYRQVTPEELHRICYATRCCRKRDRAGYVRFRHWRVDGERGVAGDAAAVWLYGETRIVSFADEALAQDTVSYQPDRHHLAAVVELERCETPDQSPQPPLWNLTADDWLTVIKVAPYAPRRPRNDDDALQPHLFPEDMIDEAS